MHSLSSGMKAATFFLLRSAERQMLVSQMASERSDRAPSKPLSLEVLRCARHAELASYVRFMMPTLQCGMQPTGPLRTLYKS